MSDELRPTILPNWKIKRAAVRFLWHTASFPVAMPPRRFPPASSAEETDACFIVGGGRSVNAILPSPIPLLATCPPRRSSGELSSWRARGCLGPTHPRLSEGSLLVQTDEIEFVNGLSGTRQKDV